MRDGDDQDRRHPEREPDSRPEGAGAEGDSDAAKESKLPFMPDENDDSEAGDTDQHSTA
jgi:hypothetical protein